MADYFLRKVTKCLVLTYFCIFSLKYNFIYTSHSEIVATQEITNTNKVIVIFEKLVTLKGSHRKVYVTFATFATLSKIDLNKQGLLVITSSQGQQELTTSDQQIK